MITFGQLHSNSIIYCYMSHGRILYLIPIKSIIKNNDGVILTIKNNLNVISIRNKNTETTIVKHYAAPFDGVLSTNFYDIVRHINRKKKKIETISIFGANFSTLYLHCISLKEKQKLIRRIAYTKNASQMTVLSNYLDYLGNNRFGRICYNCIHWFCKITKNKNGINLFKYK